MNSDDMQRIIDEMLHDFIRTQKRLAVQEALAGDWERYDWLAGRLNRILWGEQEAA